MKTNRKVKIARKPARRSTALSLSMRVERLERELLFKPAAHGKVAPDTPRFVNLGADGKPTTGEHVAVWDRQSGLIHTAAPLLNGKEVNHADALKACAELTLLGHKGWQLCDVRDLLSIIDYDRYDPAVDPARFKGPYGWTWSSTIAKSPSVFAWYVGLGVGFSYGARQSGRFRVRAVRAGQALSLGL